MGPGRRKRAGSVCTLIRILDLELGTGGYTWRFLAVDGYVDNAPGGVETGSSTCH